MESEESADAFTENETSFEVTKADNGSFTPVNPKTTFTRTNSSAKTSSTSNASKRSAPSPAEENKAKKASKFPKKKTL